MGSPQLNPVGYMIGVVALVYMTGVISFAVVQLQSAKTVILASFRDKKHIYQQTHRWGVPLLSLMGMLIAGYLSWANYNAIEVYCGSVDSILGGCNVLLMSEYARIGDFPLSLYGFGAYFIIGLLWFIQRSKHFLLGNLATLGLLAFPFSTLVVSIYLSYLEVFVLRALCIWCLFSALTASWIMVLLVNEIAKEAEVIDN